MVFPQVPNLDTLFYGRASESSVSHENNVGGIRKAWRNDLNWVKCPTGQAVFLWHTAMNIDFVALRSPSPLSHSKLVVP